jgi:hypothetical protein
MLRRPSERARWRAGACQQQTTKDEKQDRGAQRHIHE